MPDIYVLECEDGNYYVGKTSNGEKRLNQHIKGRLAKLIHGGLDTINNMKLDSSPA